MGVSSDGIVAFGWDLGDYPEPTGDWYDAENTDDESFSEQAERRLLAEIAGFTEEWIEGNEGFFDRKRAAQAAIGVEIIWHCSYDYPMFFLAALGSQVNSSRGDVLPVKFEVGTDWVEKLRRAADALGLEFEDEPTWCVFSMYG